MYVCCLSTVLLPLCGSIDADVHVIRTDKIALIRLLRISQLLRFAETHDSVDSYVLSPSVCVDIFNNKLFI